jgi:hypothetical protein
MIRKGMAEPVDDLNAPLGRNIPVKPERAGFIIRWRIIAAAAAVLLLGTAAGALLATYPIGRHAAPSTPPLPDQAAAEKTGTIPESQSIEIVRPKVPPAVPAQKPDTEPPATQTITIIDGTSGKREQVVVPVKPPSAR